jgi:hypothetical protein
MPALGIMCVTTPAERLTRGGVRGSIYSRRRFVPVTIISICRLPQRQQTNRPRQIDNGCFGTVPSSQLRGIGLNLVTFAASHDEARTGQPRPSMSINRLGI